jgi:hypothetical protein
MENTATFPTSPLLRPDQVEIARDEIKALEGKLQNPLIQDKGQVQKQLVNARRLTDAQTPQPPADALEEGRMVSRSKELLEKILDGMPSQEEMRKAPPGAVEKHRAWEKRNKPRILEWKNLQLRLTAGSGDRDAANLEKFRPTASTLNMDNAFIPGKQFYMAHTKGPAVTFSDEQLAFLKEQGFEPALMSNDQRQVVKEHLSGGIGLAEDAAERASANGKRGVQKREARKRTLSPEQKAAMKAGREAAAKRKVDPT